jgi:hypothetical protein
MVLLSFYRLHASLCAGVLSYIFFSRTITAGLLCAVTARFLWFIVEHFLGVLSINKHFDQHVYEFKQQLGPYGIRMANMAQRDWKVKKRLEEVFTPNEKYLAKNIDQLRALDALFSAGMRPDEQTYQLHDCMLKYGAYRLEKLRATRDA